jgi:hypothetical protein
LRQRQEKRLVFSWAVFDQYDSGVGRYRQAECISRECVGLEDEDRDTIIICINN